ncbi:MAG TPA: HDIG domain-containing protein [Candidatus Lokiarchaeia archaeon]|nr:HDIG domain-containing protein [Candidatus Lokiarchaeia archaeon]
MDSGIEPKFKGYDFGNQIPSDEMIFTLMSDLGLPEGIKEHCIVVKEIALDIVKQIKQRNPQADIDADVVEAGALLHDIGRTKSHGVDHGYRGYMLMREASIDERVARCALVHVLGGFDKEDIKHEFPAEARDEIKISLMPKNIEEKIVCLADKNAEGTTQVTTKKRFSRWFKKYGKSSFLLKSRYRIMQIEKDIRALM